MMNQISKKATLLILSLGLLIQCQNKANPVEILKDNLPQDKSLAVERGKYFAPSPTSQAELKISGEMLKAILSATNVFREEKMISTEYKLVENYDIEMRQSSRNYYIYFLPKRKVGEGITPGGGTSLGKYVTYEVLKKDYNVTSKMMYK